MQPEATESLGAVDRLVTIVDLERPSDHCAVERDARRWLLIQHGEALPERVRRLDDLDDPAHDAWRR